MAVSAFTVANIKPSLNIDSSQRFIFGEVGSPEPLGSFKLDNIFVPTLSTPSQTNFETRNNTFSGFRWIHTTSSTDTFGQLKLQSFVNASPTGTDIMSFGENGSVNFIAPVSFGSISSDLNMNSHKIINLATPTLATDAVTKAYVDNSIAGGLITLSGAVIGSGDVNTTIATTLATTLIAQAAIQVLSYNYGSTSVAFQLKNLYNPFGTPSETNLSLINGYAGKYNIRHETIQNVTLGDSVGLLYIEGVEPGGTIYPFLQFQVSSTGTSVLNIASDLTISGAFTSSFNMGGFKIINLANPTLATDAATKGYVDTSIAGGIITLTGAVTGSGSGTIATTLTPITVSQITDFTSAVTAFRLDQFAIPTSALNINAQDLNNVNQLGIGTNNPHSPLQFVNAFNNRIITLNETANNQHQIYGFGIGSLALRYQIDSTIASHIFYAGTSSTTSNELMRLTGTGFLGIWSGIGSRAPNSLLHFTGDNTTRRMITLNEVANNNHQFVGFGGSSAPNIGDLYFQIPNNFTAAYRWFGATSTTTSAEIMTLTGTGNLFVTNQLTVTGSTTIGGGALITGSTTIGGGALITGNVSIGTGIPANSPLQFVNQSNNRIITLNEVSNNQHQIIGLGVNNNVFRYQVGTTTTDHVWYAGTSSTTSNELMHLYGTGSLSLTTATSTLNFTLNNSNLSGITEFIINESTPALKVGYNASSSQGYINSLLASFYIQMNGVTTATFTQTGNLTLTGNLGIGTGFPNSPLQFVNQSNNRIITLNEVSNNQHEIIGLGVNTGIFRYQGNSTATDHVWYAGTSSTTSNELARITGTGEFGVNINPTYTCDIGGTTRTQKLIGNANAPTVVLGAATGTSPSSTITGTELDGTFSVTTGIGATTGLIGTFTIAPMPSSTFAIVFLPATSGTATAALMIWAASTSTTTFTLNTVTTLVAATTYKWNYIIIG